MRVNEGEKLATISVVDRFEEDAQSEESAEETPDETPDETTEKSK